MCIYRLESQKLLSEAMEVLSKYQNIRPKISFISLPLITNPLCPIQPGSTQHEGTGQGGYKEVNPGTDQEMTDTACNTLAHISSQRFSFRPHREARGSGKWACPGH